MTGCLFPGRCTSPIFLILGAYTPIVAGTPFLRIGSLFQHQVSGNDRWFSSFQFPIRGFAVCGLQQQQRQVGKRTGQLFMDMYVVRKRLCNLPSQERFKQQ
jgi:hypothetical protein